MLFPRLSALAEVLWTFPERKNWSIFEKNISSLFSRYEFMKSNYSKAFFDIQSSMGVSDTFSNRKLTWNLYCQEKENKLHVIDSEGKSIISKENKLNVDIEKSGLYKAIQCNSQKTIGDTLRQDFSINKATGKKITLQDPPDQSYAVGGAITLVDGIQNVKGMSKSSQFLGFFGNDLNAMIDLGTIKSIDSIVLHTFEQIASWIHRPSKVVISIGEDGTRFTDYETPTLTEVKSHIFYKQAVHTKARYIQIKATNYGLIPSGKPGAGYRAWLFADEIEVF
jgi:hexosaminidase